MHIALFHNIMWSKYKAGVFSALHALSQTTSVSADITQIAETDHDRSALSDVDLSYHRYPYELLFKGAYAQVPRWRRVLALSRRAWTTPADIVLLPGFDRLEYWAMLAVLVVRRKPRAVFCDSTARDRPAHWLKSVAKRVFFAACDGFLCYGTRSREYLLQHGAAAHKIHFRRQAAALPHAYTQAQALAQRRMAMARSQAEGPRFLYVGRLSPEKGLDTLIDAMALLKDALPTAQLELIGAGPLKAALIHKIETLGLTHHVKLPGSMDIAALAQRYAQATAFVLPSTSEPWGLVVNEALHYGCPCIVSDACGCVPELVIEGHTGLVFQTGHVTELASQMARAAEIFADVATTSQRCIDHMRDFRPDATAQQIVMACEKILRSTH